ncbi:carboxylesterase/lipase family protein [Rhodococcus sp. NPDC058521]|uniref:carboxylesterase/lipase family protein n=1 Tax=Rhodococcus sp. NPDC058521 TaxID=3346536 RepID=UPI00365FEE26
MARSTIVDTTEGPVRGRSSHGLIAWRGIPYAAPPVGKDRFRAPRPPSPRQDVLDCTEFGSAAPQRKLYTILRPGKYQPTSEDCLTVNVVAPDSNADRKRPVMVFIHGGAYILGSSATGLYGGSSLVRRGDVVYVSLNYRLGAFGYLDFSRYSTPERPFDSNLGLRDQVAALEWIERNIAAFGGDPDNITLFGESAGANAVTTLMTTPAAEGLFTRAIAESSAPGLVTSAERAAGWAADFVDLLPMEVDDPVEALETATPGQLGRAANRLNAKVVSETPGLHPFGPVVDGDFLPRSPLDAFADGSAHRVPLIIGNNSREGTLFTKFLGGLPTTPDRIHKMFTLTDPDAESRVTSAYPGYPSESTAVDIGGDVTFWASSIAITESHANHAPTYSYRFDFAPRALNRLGLGATHGFEMFAVFGYGRSALGRAITLPGGRRGMRAVTDAVQQHWLSFARSGVPSRSWPAYDTGTRATMIFDEKSTVRNDPRHERRLAWSGYQGYWTTGHQNEQTHDKQGEHAGRE